MKYNTTKVSLDEKKLINLNNKFYKIIETDTSKSGKIIVVTSINPTPKGEGKTTLLIGLTDAMNAHGHKAIGCLRQPSLGPVFGMKGTATGGGESVLKDDADINLHFTGDFHAITSANNLISTVIENEIYFDSPLNIDPNKILWMRCEDLNDRGLREVEVTIKKDIKYKTGFNITAASDLMALFCLVKDRKEFKDRLGQTIVAYSKDNKPITIHDLAIEDAILSILNQALYPNLAFTKYDSPVIIHGGPFANIAHGCNSIIGTNTARHLSDYVFTECGFGSDLGFEKLMNIKMQTARLKPDGVIICVTIKALIYHANNEANNDLDNLKIGFNNLLAHVDHVKQYGYEPLIVLNLTESDYGDELDIFESLCKQHNLIMAYSDIYSKGPIQNTKDLVDKVVKLVEKQPKVKYLYDVKKDSLQHKLEQIITKSYGAKGYEATPEVEKVLKDKNLQDYFICMSKTQYSLSSDPNLLNRPKDFNIVINGYSINHAAKMLVLVCDKVFRMPGLNKDPRAKNFKI